MPVSRKEIEIRTVGLQSLKSFLHRCQNVSGPSPRWFVITMSSLMIIGVLLIVLNYLTLLPGSVSRWYLWSGLGCIGIGFIMTTKYN